MLKFTKICLKFTKKHQKRHKNAKMCKERVRKSLKDGNQYPDRESNSELSFRRALLYPFNYQGAFFGCKGTQKS